MIETRIPSLLLVCAGVPIASLLLGWFWSTLPITVRKHIKPGYEAFAFLPMIVALVVIFWSLGPAFERVAFVITDASGQKIADFRYWWPAVTGASFEQRNSLVVGFMMGFAVIPIIFTITDDSLSNVPPALRTASLACGASRWQTAVRVVLPTASAGIFSAIMIGLGRAVGETMIVVMATGNTPVMEWNISLGRVRSRQISRWNCRRLRNSARLSHALPGGAGSFVLTFAVNTIAEILRQHLREIQNGLAVHAPRRDFKDLLKVHAAPGEPFVWLTSMGLGIGLLMVAGLLAVIVVNGVPVFWPGRVVVVNSRRTSPVRCQTAPKSSVKLSRREQNQ